MVKRKVSIELMLIIPVLIFMVAFYVYPFLDLLILSFNDETGFTLSKYQKIFMTDLYYTVFLRSVKIAFLVTLFSFLIGYPFAYYVTYSKRKLFLFGTVIVSMWLGVIIRSYGWMGILGKNGLLNYFLSLLGIPGSSLLYNESAIIIGMVYILMPYMILPIFSVMSGINENLLKASKSLGASNFYTFIKIYGPLSLPGIIAGSLLVFIQAIGFYITPSLLGGKDDIMIAQLIDVQVSQILDWPFASALAVILFLITIGSLLLTSKIVPLKLLWGGGK